MRTAILLGSLLALGAGALALPRFSWADGGEPRRARTGAARLAALAAHEALLARERAVPELPLPAARLVMTAAGRDDRLDVQPFDATGLPDPDAFEALGRFFRARTQEPGAEVAIDPRLVELLLMIAAAYPDRPLMLVSGHREPGRRTSKRSYHVRGMAADIAVPGVRAYELYQLARRLGARGTGLYPGFVHVDVRDVPYRWSGR